MTIEITLKPDDWHLKHVGRLKTGNGFWVDVQLAIVDGEPHDFICTYVFDEKGELIRHEITALGSRGSRVSVRDTVTRHLERLGSWSPETIRVLPFSVEDHRQTFGLVVRADEPGEEASDHGPFVDAMPGSTLMFYPPFEDGFYDT
ncbi:hypothetical protein [Halovulum sp. GXIMD14793]